MNTLEFTLLVGVGSLLAGFLGALTGLGGGVVLVPLLTLLFHVDLRYAAGASLISVIATSSGAAASYVREGYSNIRIGMMLEVATTLGALFGALLAAHTRPSAIAIIFGIVLLWSGLISGHSQETASTNDPQDALATRLRLNGEYPGTSGTVKYNVHNVPGGFLLMLGAGILSGLLGIGSGAVKVLAMDRVMRIPFKVSTTTSNFMIGVTAAASAGIYLSRGYIDPGLVLPVMLGVLAGSMTGARVLVRSAVGPLRRVFMLVILALGIEMIYSGITGRI